MKKPKDMNVGIRIYTTGAYLEPIKIITSNGKEAWVWYVTEFSDDSFFDGETINVLEYAENQKLLFSK